MRDKEQETLENTFAQINAYDLIFLLPMAWLFSYLPVHGLWSIVVNLFIIIFVGIGLFYVTHTLVEEAKKRKKRR